MVQKLLFVHGTGVRMDAFNASLEILNTSMSKWAPELAKSVAVIECRWGDSVGATLRFDGASVPTYGETRGVGVSEADQSRALWVILMQDPGFELGLLAGAQASQIRAPDAARQAASLLERFGELRKDTAFADQIAASGLTRHWPQAIADVEKTDGFKAAKSSAFAGQAPHRMALARAVVARLDGAALDAGEPTLDEETRRELIFGLAQCLGHDTRGVVSAFAAPFVGLAKYVGTWKVRRKRTALTDAGYPAAGDILVYQARGESIRDFIRAEISRHPDDDIFVFAHSLGGIASFEMLVEDTPKNVKGLITFGSQAPFFYEIGALKMLPIVDKPLPSELPLHFPFWINFYDLNDPLSYIGATLFGHRVSDYRVESGSSFPASHSAYLRSREVWIQVEAFLRHA